MEERIIKIAEELKKRIKKKYNLQDIDDEDIKGKIGSAPIYKSILSEGATV